MGGGGSRRGGGGVFGGWEEGTVVTRYGFVSVYRQEDHTNLRFIWEGRQYSRSWDTEYSQQFMVTLAKRLVRDITGHQKVG